VGPDRLQRFGNDALLAVLQSLDMHDARSRRMLIVYYAPSSDDDQALELSLECILKNLSIKAQVGNKLLESSIFIFKLFEPPHLGDTHPGKLFLPSVESLLADSHFPANLTN
jgi:hypothetical protein